MPVLYDGHFYSIKLFEMNKLKRLGLCVIPAFIFLIGCSTTKNSGIPAFKPDDPELYNIILREDSIFFAAYNTCDINKQAAIYNDDIEFYHDNGGLTTNKEEILESIRKNICGKVTRHLVQGSIEVYPIKNFGAIEIGLHKFHNNQEAAGTLSRAGKFIIIWQLKNGNWKISRVVSLH